MRGVVVREDVRCAKVLGVDFEEHQRFVLSYRRVSIVAHSDIVVSRGQGSQYV